MNIDIVTISNVLDYWLDRDNSFNYIIDSNEPTCWGCGQTWNGSYDVIRGDYRKAWTKAPLQVCHIIPKSLGGSNDLSNLVLMCKECHDLAPNSSIPEIMFAWMSKQNYLKRYFSKIKIALEDFDVEGELEDLILLSTTANFKSWFSNKSGLHWPQSGYSGMGNKMTVSTFIGLLKYYSINIQNKL